VLPSSSRIQYGTETLMTEVTGSFETTETIYPPVQSHNPEEQNSQNPD
jgi:hypothetical protein